MDDCNFYRSDAMIDRISMNATAHFISLIPFVFIMAQKSGKQNSHHNNAPYSSSASLIK